MMMLLVVLGLGACSQSQENHDTYEIMYVEVEVHAKHWEVYRQTVYMVTLQEYTFEGKTYIVLYDIVDKDTLSLFLDYKLYVYVFDEDDVNDPFKIVSGSNNLFSNPRHKVNIYRHNNYKTYVKLSDVPFLTLDKPIYVVER